MCDEVKWERVTEKIRAHYKIMTKTGPIRARDYCVQEVARIQQNGHDARLGEGNKCFWVERLAKEVIID